MKCDNRQNADNQDFNTLGTQKGYAKTVDIFDTDRPHFAFTASVRRGVCRYLRLNAFPVCRISTGDPKVVGKVPAATHPATSTDRTVAALKASRYPARMDLTALAIMASAFTFSSFVVLPGWR